MISNNHKATCLVLSMENALLNSSMKGGLGILMKDYFLEAYEKNYPLIFVSLSYPNYLKQVKNENSILIENKKSDIENSIDTGIVLEVNSCWYKSIVKVLKYPLENNAKAYFLYFDFDNNENWLRELVVYGEKDEGQLLYTRYLLAEGSIQLMKKLNLDFDILHLQESDTALAIKPALEYNKNIKIVYTIHTPLSHGHKKIRLEKIKSLYGYIPEEFKVGIEENCLSLTKLAAYYANKIFTVSKMQEEIEKKRLEEYKNKISSISNAVNRRWINKHLVKLFDEKIPTWKNNPIELKNKINNISDEELEKSLIEAKKDLIEKINYWNNNNEVISNFYSISSFDNIFTFARRISQYKRPIEFLRAILSLHSPSIFIFSGPLVENYSYEFFNELINTTKKYNIKIAYILNFDEEKAYYLVSGSDFWVNIPISLLEASGTSHMKAVINGKILISTPSGTVPEYIINGYNGILVKDDLSDLKEKIKFAENLSREEKIRFAKNSIASSHYILMNRMFDEYIKEYNDLIKITQ